MINCRTSWFGFFGSKPASDSSPQKSQDGSPSTKTAIAEEGSAGEGRSRDRRTTETSTSSSQCSTSDPEAASGPPNPKKKKAYKKTLRLSTDLIVSDPNVLLKQLSFR